MPLGHGWLSWNWMISLPMDGSYSCLWCFCWVSFLVKPYGRGLVMDDNYGQTKLNLDPISCPLALVSSMILLAWHMVIFHWLKDSPGGMSGWSEIKHLGCWHIAEFWWLTLSHFLLWHQSSCTSSRSFISSLMIGKKQTNWPLVIN